MSLQASIQSDLTSALKAQDAARLALLRLVKAALLNQQKDTGVAELSDEQVLAVLGKEAKKRREAADLFVQSGRQDLADQELAEHAIIATYLPQQLSDDEVAAAVQAAAAQLASREFAVVMPAVMQQVKGRADGKRVKAAVEALLKH